ncbi:hypothetical protein P5_0034 [Aeromonas phage P5]|nr:hypothetical protein P5_0034 [Aeromonas phage P5]
MNISRALLGLLVVAPFTGNAASLIVGGASYHIGTSTYEYQGQTHQLNQINPAIGIEADGWSLVAVQNSYEKVSVLATKDWQWSVADDWTAGVKVGTATGYKDTPINMDVAPFMQFEVGYTYKAVTTVIGYVPPVQDGMKGVITLHWKIKLQ